jgi:CAAX protease family protein
VNERRARIALVVVAVVLTAQHYIGDRSSYHRFFPAGDSLGAYTFWALSKIIGYLAVPLVVVAVWRARPSDFGLGLGDTLRHWKIYAGLFLAVLPLVVGASFTTDFQSTYPFYRGPGQLRWETLYGLSFVSLEFFFRGFALYAVERAAGRIAIFVMVVPYTMIHFGKPVPEVLGAIVAGVILGHMSLKTRSIWGGVAVHMGVAWTMDALALYHTKNWG